MILAKNFHLKGGVLGGGGSILGNFLGTYWEPMDFRPEMVILLVTFFKNEYGERLFSWGPMAKSATPMQDSPYGRSKAHGFLYILPAQLR